MESLREKYLRGSVDEQSYTTAAIQKTIEALERKNYKYIRTLRSGFFGTVIEAQIPYNKQPVAAKILLKEKVFKNEIEIWSRLKDENILPLYGYQYCKSAYTYVFYSPKGKITLDRNLHDIELRADANAMDIILKWLREISSGLLYLHWEHICHMDLRSDSVLISERGHAVICDLGFVCEDRRPVSRYGMPIFYRPPEAWNTIRKTEEDPPVDGKNFDIWCLGILAFEMVTREALLRQITGMNLKTFTSWTLQIYPEIFRMLQRCELRELIKDAYVRTNSSPEDLEKFVSFFSWSCHVNPDYRLRAVDAVGHPLLNPGLSLSLVQVEIPFDVWRHRVNSVDIDLHIARALEDNDNYAVTSEEHDRSQAEGETSPDASEMPQYRILDVRSPTGCLRPSVARECISSSEPDTTEEDSVSCTSSAEEIEEETPKPRKKSRLRRWWSSFSKLFTACKRCC